MTTITLPSIPVPTGCEAQAALLFRSLQQFFRFTAEPSVVEDAAMRSVTSSFEHALEAGAKQAEQAAHLPTQTAA